MMNSRASMLAQGVANERRNGIDVLPDSGFSFRLNEQGYRGNNGLRDDVANFVSQYLDKHKDPAADIKGMPPLFGQDVLPHAMTFQSLIGSYAKTYLPADEALEANPNDAAQMLKNVGIRECLQIRQFMVALTGWSIQPENSKSPAQKSLAAMLTKCLQRIRRFTEYRRCMQAGIWSGKSAIQHRYGYDLIDGQEHSPCTQGAD